MTVYTLTSPAYGLERGDTVTLNAADPLVQMNVDNGVLVEGKDQKTEPAKMTCPICGETMQRPPKFSDPPSLEAHYEEKHAGFVVPDWQPDEEDNQA